MSDSSFGSNNQNVVSPDEILIYSGALLNLLTNRKNSRLTIEVHRLKGIINALFSQISALRELGVTYSEIASRLESKGLVIDGDTLQDMYYEYRERVIKEFISEMIFKRPAEDAFKKFRESSRLTVDTGHTEAKPMVTPAPASAPSPAQTTDDSDSDSSARVATPPTPQVRGKLPDPTATQMARVRDRDLDAILNNVIDVSKIPKRED